MPSTNVVNGINDQIAKEFASAYLYLSMAAYLEHQNLPGFTNWMRVQYQEEVAHAMRLLDFLLDLGAKVELQAIPKPASTFKGPLDVLKQTLAHEKKVTASITKLYELALKARDYPTQVQLQWFISEQLEEEKTAAELVAQLERAGNNGAALLMIDRELAGRTAGGEEGGEDAE